MSASKLTDQILNLNITVRNIGKEVTDLTIELEQQEAPTANETRRFAYLEAAESNLKAALDMLDAAWESSRIADRASA